MKRFLLVAAATAMVAGSAGAAAAQPYGNAYGHRNKDYRDAQKDVRKAQRRAERQWRRGEILPSQYRGSSYVLNDYSRYGLQAPPSGYRYYRDGDNVIMSAITSGVIQMVLNGVLGGGQGSGLSGVLGVLGGLGGAGGQTPYGYGGQTPYGYSGQSPYGYGGGQSPYGYGGQSPYDYRGAPQPRGYDRYGRPIY